MKKGFFSGMGAAGSLFGVFMAVRDLEWNEIILGVITFCVSVPAYIFAVKLRIPDTVTILGIFLYFGIVGLLLESLLKKRKGRIFLITGFVIIILSLHWFFDVKISETIASIFDIEKA